MLLPILTAASCTWLGRKPVPPPEPPTPPSYHAASVAVLIGLCSIVFLALYVYIRYKWPVWFDIVARTAFEKVDADGSRVVNANEFYTSVLWLYLTLNEYGVRCCAPEKAVVTDIMRGMDIDHNGSLDYREFKSALEIISQQVLGRFLTQLGFTLLCPPAATVLCANIYHGWTFTGCASRLPDWLTGAAALIPPSIPVTLLSTLLMLMLPLGLSAMDARAKRKVEKRAAALLGQGEAAANKAD